MKTVITLVLFFAWMMLTVLANTFLGSLAAVAAFFLPAFAFILASERRPW